MSFQKGCCYFVFVLGQLPTIEAEGFGKSVQKDAALATVRVINQKNDTLGVGVLLTRSGPISYILTAGHLVEDAEMVDVHVFDAKAYPKAAKIHKDQTVIARGKDKQPDLALVKLVGYEGESKGVRVCPLSKLPKEKKFAALTLGCGEQLAPKLYLVTVQDVVRAKKPGEARVGSYFRTAEKSMKGQSGGPLLDRQGQLLGICSGANGGRGYYCDLDEIHAFLTANGLGSLLKAQP